MLKGGDPDSLPIDDTPFLVGNRMDFSCFVGFFPQQAAGLSFLGQCPWQLLIHSVDGLPG